MLGGEPVGMPVKRAGNPGRTYPLARKCTLARLEKKTEKHERKSDRGRERENLLSSTESKREHNKKGLR